MKDFCQIEQVEIHVMMSLQVDLHGGDEIDWRLSLYTGWSVQAQWFLPLYLGG